LQADVLPKTDAAEAHKIAFEEASMDRNPAEGANKKGMREMQPRLEKVIPAKKKEPIGIKQMEEEWQPI
jgi:hypothetical protein